MPLVVERLDARSWPESELDALCEGALPGYTTADQEAKACTDLVLPGLPGVCEHAQRP